MELLYGEMEHTMDPTMDDIFYCTHGSWGKVKPLQYMLIYMYLSIMLLCSNQHSVVKC